MDVRRQRTFVQDKERNIVPHNRRKRQAEKQKGEVIVVVHTSYEQYYYRKRNINLLQK